MSVGAEEIVDKLDAVGLIMLVGFLIIWVCLLFAIEALYKITDRLDKLIAKKGEKDASS